MRFFDIIRGHRGNAILEFAFILPMFLVIAFGITDFGLYFHRMLSLDHAVRQGARFGALGQDNDSIKTAVQNASPLNIPSGDIQIRVYDTNGQEVDNTLRTPGFTIQVSVNLADYQLITPVGNLIDALGSFPLAGTRRFVIEGYYV